MGKTLLCPNFRCAQDGIAADSTECPKCSTPLGLGQHYHLLRALSQGGMGSTYLAEDRRFRASRSERCVIKEIKSEHHDKDFVAMLQREAGGLLQLRHPGIPAYRDFFEAAPGGPPSRWFLVQEAIEGESLQKRLSDGHVFTLEEGLDIFRQSLEILQYLHELKDPETGRLAPVIHLDIKPDNLMRRTSDNRIFLIDFGVASQLQHTIQGSKGAKASVYGYTLGFAPFEQTLGYAAPSSDLYSLTMTFLVLLTGESPLALFDPIEQTARFHRFVSLPTPLALLISRMLRVNMKERVSSAREALACLSLASEAMGGDSKALQSLMETLRLSQTLQGAIIPEGSIVGNLANGAIESMVLAKADTLSSSAQNQLISLPKEKVATFPSEHPIPSLSSLEASVPKRTWKGSTWLLMIAVFVTGWFASRLSSIYDEINSPRNINPPSTPKPPNQSAKTSPSAHLTKKKVLDSKKAPLYRPLTPPLSSTISLPPSPTSRPVALVRPLPPSTQPTAALVPAQRRQPTEPPIPSQILEDLKPEYSTAVKAYALRSLAKIHTKQARTLLYQHLQEPPALLQKIASESLASMGESAVETLTQAMKIRNYHARRFAANALAKIGPPARGALPLLLLSIEEPLRDVRMCIAILRAIRAMKPAPEEAWPPFLSLLLRSFSSDVRREIAISVVQLRFPQKLISPDIQKGLQSPRTRVLQATLSLLEFMGPAAIDFLPFLQEVLRNPSTAFGRRYSILSSIVHLGPKTLPFWEEAYHVDRVSHNQAMLAFKRYKEASLPVVERLFSLEKDVSRRLQLVYLTPYMGRKALPFLQKAAKDAEPRIQTAAEKMMEKVDTAP